MRFLVSVLFVVALHAQALPANWIGSGVGYNPSGSPKGTGWLSFAHRVNEAGQIYSYSTYDAIPIRGAVPMLSTRTGLATPLRSFGPITLVGFGTAGVAQGAEAVSLAVSGGGIAVWAFKSGLTIEIGARVVKAGPLNTTVYEFGFGKAW